MCNEVGKIAAICEIPIVDWFGLDNSELSRSTARERDSYRMCYGSRAYWLSESRLYPVVFPICPAPERHARRET